MYSSSYSSLYQHTATNNPNPYTNASATSNNNTSPLAPFNNGLSNPDPHSLDQSPSSGPSSSSSHNTSMTSPLGNFSSSSSRNNNTNSNNPLLSSSTGNNNNNNNNTHPLHNPNPNNSGYLSSNPYSSSDDLISSQPAYQLVSGSNRQHHNLPQTSSASSSLLSSTIPSTQFSFTFPPLPPNESNLDQSYNLYQTSSSTSTAPRKRGHKASSSSLASILIKPDLTVDSSGNTTIRTRNPSPHRQQASITTATAGLSLGDNNNSNNNPAATAANPSSDTYPYSHHRRSSSSNSLSPLKSNSNNNNTSNSTAASTPVSSSSSSSLAVSSAAAYRAHRRRRSAKNHSVDRDSVIVALFQKGKSLSEIARIAGLDTEEEVRLHYESIINRRIDWTAEDIDSLKELLEAGERAKWKYISDEVSRDRNKRIPATACQKKFKEMFGVAEASSILGSSLCYVVFPDGWSCLDGKPIDMDTTTSGGGNNRPSLQSVYENEHLIQ